MNQVVLIGRLTKDPVVNYTQGDNPTCVARFSLAVKRMYKKDGEEQVTDFINCVSFAKTGEFIEKHTHKGTKLAVVGKIQTGTYKNKEGQKVYTTEVVVESCEFAESKNSNEGEETQGEGEFMQLTEEELKGCSI